MRNGQQTKLRDLLENLQEIEEKLNEQAQTVDATRIEIQAFQKELAEGSGVRSNMQDNLRIRQLQREIQDTHNEIGSIDLEELARAKRQFDDRFAIEEEKLNQLQNNVWLQLFLYDYKLSVLIGRTNRRRDCVHESTTRHSRRGPCRIQRHTQTVPRPTHQGQGTTSQCRLLCTH